METLSGGNIAHSIAYNVQLVIFEFFILSFIGWVLESIQETIVRGKLISKGFFRGPYIPVEGLGGICVYFICVHFKGNPLHVFAAGAVLCDAVEYLTSLFLKKCFGVQCWDYRTYPHTKWCHFQGRICLTFTIFFGAVALAIVYFLWDFGIALFNALNPWSPFITGILTGVFLFDAITRCAEVIRAKRSGKKLEGWSLFSS